MKKIIGTIIRVVILLLVIVWMGFLVVDYFRAKDGNKPIVCLSEKTIQKGNNTYYQCVSFGYKYFEYTKEDGKTFGFGAAFIENKAEKEIGEMNE